VYFRDIALLAITSPTDTVDSGRVLSPQARVRNNGTQDETFLMYFRIPDESYDHWSMARALPPGHETLLTFTPWTPGLFGDHGYSGLLVAGDMDPSNDALDGSVYVRTGAGIAEYAETPAAAMPMATVIRGVLFLSERTSSSASTSCLLDISGREVLNLKPGANDVRALEPGVYFVRDAQAQAQAVRKVVVTR
jgi:hypothetical protein